MITSSSQIRSGDTTVVTVVSSLSGTVYYFWYLDGAYVGFTTSPQKTFLLTPGAQAVVECLDSNSSSFDPIANAPAGYPATRTILFSRSIDPNIASYRIEQKENSGSWSAIGYVSDDSTKWQYSFPAGMLDDLATYQWRVYPIDIFGNDGTVLTLASELIVRTPDAPDFAVAFNAGTTKVTFSA